MPIQAPIAYPWSCRRQRRIVLLALLAVAGCATRPVNPRIAQVDTGTGYRFETRNLQKENKDNLIILAFSGGGTRAAAFSYGVLEFLRRTEVTGPQGNLVRLLDEVDIITGVSGGQFHGAGLRPVRREVVRRLRDSLSQAQYTR